VVVNFAPFEAVVVSRAGRKDAERVRLLDNAEWELVAASVHFRR
jgi:hypothetical protein